MLARRGAQTIMLMVTSLLIYLAMPDQFWAPLQAASHTSDQSVHVQVDDVAQVHEAPVLSVASDDVTTAPRSAVESKDAPSERDADLGPVADVHLLGDRCRPGPRLSVRDSLTRLPMGAQKVLRC